MYLRDDNGNTINAECSLDVIGGVDCIVVESSGGASSSPHVRRRNPAYNELVRTILTRLRDAGVSATNIILDSGRVTRLPEAARTVSVSHAYPIHLSAVNIEELRKEIGRRVATMHRAVGTSTGGNQQKRIRICVSRRIEPVRLITGKPQVASEQCEPDEPPNVGLTEKRLLRDARVGQGKFRSALLKRHGGCCVATGISHGDVLIASHIKPWSVSTSHERLDPWNGFLFSAMIDKLFDRGLISFTDDGRLLVSPRLTDGDRKLCGLSNVRRIAVPPRSLGYLAYHRHHWQL
jgi:hypothetical protein